LITSTGKGGAAGWPTLGVMAADQVLMWTAVAGVAALLLGSPALSARCSGWAQPTWHGWACGCCLPNPRCPDLNILPRHYFRQAAMITLLNPKRSSATWRSFRVRGSGTAPGAGTFTVMALTHRGADLPLWSWRGAADAPLAERLRANPLITRRSRRRPGCA
jgi:threonine/homoserine/homoserine lactone efflux protein